MANIAIENGHRNSEFSHQRWWLNFYIVYIAMDRSWNIHHLSWVNQRFLWAFSIVMLVYQRVCGIVTSRWSMYTMNTLRTALFCSPDIPHVLCVTFIYLPAYQQCVTTYSVRKIGWFRIAVKKHVLPAERVICMKLIMHYMYTVSISSLQIFLLHEISFDVYTHRYR